MRKIVLSDGKHVWECIECGKKHHNKSNIIQHVDLHIQGVQYICEYCQKQFKSQGSLNVHVTTKHRDLKKRIKNYYWYWFFLQISRNPSATWSGHGSPSWVVDRTSAPSAAWSRPVVALLPSRTTWNINISRTWPRTRVSTVTKLCPRQMHIISICWCIKSNKLKMFP